MDAEWRAANAAALTDAYGTLQMDPEAFCARHGRTGTLSRRYGRCYWCQVEDIWADEALRQIDARLLFRPGFAVYLPDGVNFVPVKGRLTWDTYEEGMLIR